MSHDARFMVEKIKEKLIGGVIRNAIINEDEDGFGFEIAVPIKGMDGKHDIIVVWVDRDAEGNGQGWLDIVE